MKPWTSVLFLVGPDVPTEEIVPIAHCHCSSALRFVVVSSPCPGSDKSGQLSSDLVIWLILSKTSLGAGALDGEIWGAAACSTDSSTWQEEELSVVTLTPTVSGC